MMALLTTIVFALLISFSQGVEQCGWGYPRNPLQHQLLCLDDTAGQDPASWAPWTHRPFCVESAESPWCVYTNAAVPRGQQRGMSIITTPELAADTFNLLNHPLERAFSAFPPSKTYKSRPYEVYDVPGKGKGAVATQRIEKGKVILIDHAMLMATVEYPADVMHEEVQDLIRTGVERLPDPQRVRELAQRGREELSLEEDILIINSFELSIGGKGYMGLFPDVSRINHACKPNARLHFSDTTFAMTIWSVRDIEPGEEITISYPSIELPYVERQEALSSIWGFNCSCSLCHAPGAIRKVSDARRLEFRELRNKVIKLAKNGEFRAAVEASEELFRVVDEEGLGPHMGDLYEIPARLSYQVGDLEKAREYLKRSMFEYDGLGVPGADDQVRLEEAQKILDRLEAEIEKRGEKK